MVRVFGIRHHGPGSSRSLQLALQDWQPDILLIEGTVEGEQLLGMVSHLEMEPPVAMLIYSPKDINKAAYYPFAGFSPEWLAIKHGLQEGIPIRLIDLPISMQWHDSYSEKLKDTSTQFAATEAMDPLTEIARQAGFESGERWWESVVEQRKQGEDLFEHLLELIKIMREKITPSASNLLREAYMRKGIRQASKEGFERIAVVCGAYHAPALDNLPAAKEDNALLKGLRKTKVNATWIPWTYERLCYSSGYGAGVLSPAWYELLFSKARKDLVPYWMVKVAALLRENGLDASPANVIEGVRLTEMLTSLRALEVPGLEEMQEAVMSVFSLRDDAQLKLIHRKLIVGEKMGKVPTDVPLLPLQQEVNRIGAKYKKPKYLKKTELKLDLRDPKKITESRFFHRLNLLGVYWGKLSSLTGNKGSFWEVWNIKWDPEFELAIIEAATWGNTLEAAATAFVNEELSNAKADVSRLAEILTKTFLADLPSLLLIIVKRLSDAVALNQAVVDLMDTVLPLVNVMRYGNVRQTEVALVETVIEAALPRIFIGLPATCKHVNDEMADTLFAKMIAVNNAIQLLHNPAHTESWNHTLQSMIRHSLDIHRKLAGAICRMLMERKLLSPEQVGTNMNLELSSRLDHTQSARWLEGFLYGTGLLLIHNPVMIKIISDWLKDLKEDVFLEILPLLRRSFSEYSNPERASIARIVAAKDEIEIQKYSDERNFQNIKHIEPILKTLLG